MQNKTDFNAVHIERLLSGLREDTPALWGMMKPQHMCEHLTIGVKASTGRTRPVVALLPDQIEIMKKELLENDDPWPRGMKNPFLPRDRPPDLKYGTLQEAKQKLVAAVLEFEQYYKENPLAKQPNPFLGYLGYADWLQFHFKHFRHHFTQFGLITPGSRA